MPYKSGFEWDEDKRQANIAKHGVDFLRAALIFDGPVVQRIDDRFEYEEIRMISLGLSEGMVYRVIHTERDSRQRIISAQKANRNEQEIFYRSVFGGGNP
ncbi:MAG: BrnT family toxin [Rhizobiales bacterium]|nr:BrnT family toxin [Hyphomicrobiales bacterium]